MPPDVAAPDAPDAPRRAPGARRALLSGLALGLLVVGLVLGIWVVRAGEDSAPSTSVPSEGAVSVPGVAEVGRPAPGFEVPGLDGPAVRLDEYRGRPVVLTFWASWCKPCRDEFPLLASARESHTDAGLEVLGVTYEDLPADSIAFAEELGVDWPLGRDEDGSVARSYGVRAIPQTFFIDPDGVVRGRVYGLSDEELLDELLAEIL
ncbi:MAG: TlpA family protein disulfide reductase [Acidimicrobiia bacterium]|nr:TlpA family protein disulfide reductase [Acidimicrobiia bacterium]